MPSCGGAGDGGVLVVLSDCCGWCGGALYMGRMSSETGRWWSLSPRRRRVAIIATSGSGLLTLVAAGLAAGWSDWRDVVGMVCSVTAIAAIVTTISMPIVDDRRRNPLLRLDRRTKRRAFRCIRRGDCVGAPVGIDLDQVAFFWGGAQVRSLRLPLPMGLLVFGGALADRALWFQIFRVGFALVFIISVVHALRDVRLCRRFLIASVGSSVPGS